MRNRRSSDSSSARAYPPDPPYGNAPAVPRSHRLAEYFADFFNLVLQLRSTQEYGDAQTLNRRVIDVLEQSSREAVRHGAFNDDVEQARFALAAFIDETIAVSNWSQKSNWQPLQLELFDRFDAGEEFFTRLEELLRARHRPLEVLEVYHLCMVLGFKGKYRMFEQEKLRTLIEDAQAAIGRDAGPKTEVLSPHGKPRDQVIAEVKSKLPGWVALVAVLAVCLTIYLGLSLYLSNVADETAQTLETTARIAS